MLAILAQFPVVGAKSLDASGFCLIVFSELLIVLRCNDVSSEPLGKSWLEDAISETASIYAIVLHMICMCSSIETYYRYG